jgi:hypothetical protein
MFYFAGQLQEIRRTLTGPLLSGCQPLLHSGRNCDAQSNLTLLSMIFKVCGYVLSSAVFM